MTRPEGTRRDPVGGVAPPRGDASGRDVAIARGYMMKRKRPSSFRPVTLNWDTRYFVLRDGGALAYYRHPPTGGSTEGGPSSAGKILCRDVRTCVVDRPAARDLRGGGGAGVANAFVVASFPGTKDRRIATLLVARGPEDYRMWIRGLDRLGAEVRFPLPALPRSAGESDLGLDDGKRVSVAAGAATTTEDAKDVPSPSASSPGPTEPPVAVAATTTAAARAASSSAAAAPPAPPAGAASSSAAAKAKLTAAEATTTRGDDDGSGGAPPTRPAAPSPTFAAGPPGPSLGDRVVEGGGAEGGAADGDGGDDGESAFDDFLTFLEGPSTATTTTTTAAAAPLAAVAAGSAVSGSGDGDANGIASKEEEEHIGEDDESDDDGAIAEGKRTGADDASNDEEVESTAAALGDEAPAEEASEPAPPTAAGSAGEIASVAPSAAGSAASAPVVEEGGERAGKLREPPSPPASASDEGAALAPAAAAVAEASSPAPSASASPEERGEEAKATDAAADAEALVKSLERRRRAEQRALMRDKTLTKDERKAAMEEAKEKYARLVEDAKRGAGGAVGAERAAANGGETVAAAGDAPAEEAVARAIVAAEGPAARRDAAAEATDDEESAPAGKKDASGSAIREPPREGEPLPAEPPRPRATATSAPNEAAKKSSRDAKKEEAALDAAQLEVWMARSSRRTTRKASAGATADRTDAGAEREEGSGSGDERATAAARDEAAPQDARSAEDEEPRPTKAEAAVCSEQSKEEEEEAMDRSAEPGRETARAAIEALETTTPKEKAVPKFPEKNTDRLAAAESALAALNEAPSSKGGPAEAQREEENASKREGEMSLRVHAYGDTFDEMMDKVSANKSEEKMLVGVLVASLDEMGAAREGGDDASASGKPRAFLLDLAGNNKPRHLREIERIFCRDNERSKFDELRAIFYDEEEGTRDQIVAELRTSANANDPKGSGEGPAAPSSSDDDPSRKTAYELAEPTPTGTEILTVVREPLGTPYNWVLFRPSKKELLAEDAGSGGVVEMTRLLPERYDDRVLFGLMRLSFVGDTFGRRQFWAGLEWKGEECHSVKQKMQLTNCLNPMKRMIGDASFTLTNLTASEMTPEEVVDRVRRFCNAQDFDATVEALKRGHEEEQEAIRAYWEKERGGTAGAKKGAGLDWAAAEEEETRRKFDGDARGLRKWKWSRLNAKEVLSALGTDGLPGWVLLDVAVPLIED
ncbi:hypothetical protein ACHAWF_012050 [Thalassiosira exigua]